MQGEVTFDTDLLEPYQPKALYFEESDILEYVRVDSPCVHKRIDEMLTLVLDLHSQEPIGFTVKGFRNFYWQVLKPKYQATEEDFVRMTSVLEEAIGLLGDGLFGDRQKAYKRALEIATKDEVHLSDDELPRAA